MCLARWQQRGFGGRSAPSARLLVVRRRTQPCASYPSGSRLAPRLVCETAFGPRGRIPCARTRAGIYAAPTPGGARIGVLGTTT